MLTKNDLVQIREVVTEVVQAIADSQEDTIKSLSEVMEFRYQADEQRFKKIEAHLGFPLQQ